MKRIRKRPLPGASPENGHIPSNECSIKSCQSTALAFIGSPYCRRHLEMTILVKLALLNGWVPSLGNITKLRAITPVRWHINGRQLPGLLADVLIHRKQHETG